MRKSAFFVGSYIHNIQLTMNYIDIRVQRRLCQLLYQHRERRRQYKFYNFLPIIYEETDFDISP